MWGAVRRWKGGPLWRRILLFVLYVLRDLVDGGRRTALVAGTAAALLLGAMLLPFGSESEPPGAQDAEQVELATHGAVRFRGQWMTPSELGHVLDHFGVRSAAVAVESDASYRVVDELHEVMVAHDVEVVRVRFADSF
jgi:hypothetical protein